MSRLIAMTFGMILGGGIVFAAGSLHVTRSAEGIMLVPREPMAVVDCYVDVRNWTAREWTKHPELIQALESQGRGHLVKRTDSNRILQQFFQLKSAP